MAIDEEQTTVEVSESASPPAKKGSRKLILICAVVLVCVGLGAGVGLFMTKSSAPGDESGESAKTTEKADSKHDSKKKAKQSHGDGEGGSGSVVYAIKDIVVNPAGTGGSRFLSVSFGIELDSEDLASEFERRDPLVRDALITILSSKTVAQLMDAKQKEIMRFQIKKRLEKVMQTGGVTGVYFTDFVLQ